MRKIEHTGQFKRDYKRETKGRTPVGYRLRSFDIKHLTGGSRFDDSRCLPCRQAKRNLCQMELVAAALRGAKDESSPAGRGVRL